MTDKTQTCPAWFGQVNMWFATLSAIVLAFMMVFIFAGAVLRYAFNAPISGGNEILEMASVAIVMLAVPYCTTQDAHVRIDLLDNALGRVGRLLTEILYRLIAVVVLWFLVKSYVARTLDAREYEDVTNMLDIPLWPFYGLIVFGMGLYGIILAVQLVMMARPFWSVR